MEAPFSVPISQHQLEIQLDDNAGGSCPIRRLYRTLKRLQDLTSISRQLSYLVWQCRSVRIKLTNKAREVRDTIHALYQKHMRTVEQVGGISAAEFPGATAARAVLDRPNSLSA